MQSYNHFVNLGRFAFRAAFFTLLWLWCCSRYKIAESAITCISAHLHLLDFLLLPEAYGLSTTEFILKLLSWISENYFAAHAFRNFHWHRSCRDIFCCLKTERILW